MYSISICAILTQQYNVISSRFKMLWPIPNDSAYVQPPSMVGAPNSGRQISRTGKVEAEPQNIPKPHRNRPKESCNAP